MAPKRSNDAGSEEMTGRERKKLKVSAARTIAVQSAAARTNSPSSSEITQRHLPSTIDLEKFIEARSFEIDAMHTAMKTASSSSTHRVWQTLPRHLRRRAASHDVRRVPLRLRERASVEMDLARKKALSHAAPKRGKEKRVRRTDAFLKRQRNKIWLETHLWHSKRMHMENLWGYRLAVSPTEKAYRPSHRASMHGSTLHDASYYSCMEIKGPEKLVVALLESCCDPQGPGPGSQRYKGGSRVLETHIYGRNTYPHDLIAPLTVIWRPQPQTSNTLNKNDGAMATDDPTTVHTIAPLTVRSVWLRFHPSVHILVFETLKEAASHCLSHYKSLYGDSEEATIDLIDLRGLINVFEIMGPKSSQVVKGALSPVTSEQRRDFLQFWASLTDLQSAGSLPRGMIVGLKVTDPRLKFPPKNAKPTKIGPNNVPSAHITLPSARLADSEIWNYTTYKDTAKPRFKKKDIDERRAKNKVPGAVLHARHEDDRIPILLIQSSVENSTSSESQAIHGWTLMIPAGWSMAFFNSLVFTNTRVGGQFQRQTQTYEAGAVYFPRDYPSTAAYSAYAQGRALEEKSIWERKPPAKRVNYEKLGTRNPWMADWGSVTGVPIGQSSALGDGDFITTQREHPITSPANGTTSSMRPWLLRGSEVPKILSSITSVFNHSTALLSEINRLRLKRGFATLSSVTSSVFLEAALINVKITMLLRGSPQDHAMIYVLSDDVCRQWKKIIYRQKSGAAPDEETDEEVELANVVPHDTFIIGHITTGHYSLARGRGFAIGSVALTKLLELEQQSIRVNTNQRAPGRTFPMLVGMRNVNGYQCRIGSIEVLLD